MRPTSACPNPRCWFHNARLTSQEAIVFRYKGFRFFFFSNEGSPREPLHVNVHVHVRSADGDAKYWLKSSVGLAGSSGFDARTLRELAQVVESNALLIEGAWDEHFS